MTERHGKGSIFFERHIAAFKKTTRNCIKETKMLFYMIEIHSVQVYTRSKYSEAGCVDVNAHFNLNLVFKTCQDNLLKFLDVLVFKLRDSAKKKKSDNSDILGRRRDSSVLQGGLVLLFAPH